MNELLSITDISRRTSIPETTVRRYINLFYDFIGTHEKSVSARNKRYSKDVLVILDRIYSLYSEGKSTNEIYDSLKEKFSHAVAVEVAEPSGPSPVALQSMFNFIGLIKNQGDIMCEIKSQLEEMRQSSEMKISQMEADIKNILQEQLKAIEQTAVDVKNTVEEDKQRQKEYIEERDSLIIKQMRKVFEENKQEKFSLFKRWRREA